MLAPNSTVLTEFDSNPRPIFPYCENASNTYTALIALHVCLKIACVEMCLSVSVSVVSDGWISLFAWRSPHLLWLLPMVGV